eukprot:s1329_g16.t1
MKIEKMLEFLVEAGFNPERLQFLVPISKMRGTNEEKAQMRHVISNFLARLLKGTFPDNKKHYAYFRHVDEGFEEVIHFTPLIVYLIHRIKERSDEVLITARQSGVILPPDFQAKIDFTMSYASAEAARGKHQRLTNVARNLEETVVKAAIGDVGDTAAAKMGRAAAEAAAKAPPRMETPKSYAPQHPPPSPAAASSSSTPSVPKAKQERVKHKSSSYRFCGRQMDETVDTFNGILSLRFAVERGAPSLNAFLGGLEAKDSNLVDSTLLRQFLVMVNYRLESQQDGQDLLPLEQIVKAHSGVELSEFRRHLSFVRSLKGVDRTRRTRRAAAQDLSRFFRIWGGSPGGQMNPLHLEEQLLHLPLEADWGLEPFAVEQTFNALGLRCLQLERQKRKDACLPPQAILEAPKNMSNVCSADFRWA